MTPIQLKPLWTLKPIFGRESREAILNQFLKNLPGDIARLNANLMKEIDRYRCRLLCRKAENENIPEGILIYGRELQERCLKVELLCPLAVETRSNSILYDPMIEEIKNEAKELKAKSIEILIPKTEAAMAKAFLDRNFKIRFPVVKSEVDCDLLSYRFEEPILRKRGRDESPSAGRFDKRPRTEEKYFHSTQRAPQKPNEATLMKRYVEFIKNGQKTIEGRINAGMFRNLRAGTTFRFFYSSAPGCDVVCKIKKVTPYTSFESMLRAEGYKKCIPDAGSLEHAIAIYDRIPGYSKRAAESGVLAIEVESLGTSNQ